MEFKTTKKQAPESKYYDSVIEIYMNKLPNDYFERNGQIFLNSPIGELESGAITKI